MDASTEQLNQEHYELMQSLDNLDDESPRFAVATPDFKNGINPKFMEYVSCFIQY